MKITKLETLRREKGLSKTALGKQCGIQYSMIGWIESGRFKPYPSQLEKLAKALGVEDPQALLEEVEV